MGQKLVVGVAVDNFVVQQHGDMAPVCLGNVNGIFESQCHTAVAEGLGFIVQL